MLFLRDDVSTVTRPVKELRGFRKVRLEPGETKEVAFPLGFADLALLDAHLEAKVEAGTFTVFVGGLEASFRVIG